jgi:hypothetical protein
MCVLYNIDGTSASRERSNNEGERGEGDGWIRIETEGDIKKPNTSHGVPIYNGGVLLHAGSIGKMHCWPTCLILNRRQMFRFFCSLVDHEMVPLLEVHIRDRMHNDTTHLCCLPLSIVALLKLIAYHIDGWWSTNQDFPDPLGPFILAEDEPIVVKSVVQS